MPARPSVVCTECHRLKIGCNKALPCDQCTFHHRICEYQRPACPPIDNDVLQERVLNIELYYERARQKLLVPTQRVVDFDSDPPSETGSDAARQDALLATCPSDVFQILSKVLSLSPERASAIQAAHATNRPPIPLFLLPDHYYYIDRDGDPCVTPALLALLPSVDEQVNLLKIVKDVFTFQPLGSHDDLVRRVDLLRNAPSAVQEPNPLSRLNHLALYAIATGAFALAAIGSARPTLSSTRAINLYTAGRRALQLVTSHPQLSPNLVDHLWSGALLLQFLLFSHRLTGGEQPDSGVWHRDWVRAEIRVVLGMVIQACEDREANQSLQQSVSNDAHSRDLREWAKLACAVYYYEMHLSDVFNVPSLLPIDPPFTQMCFESDALFLATRTSLIKLLKTSRHQLRSATSKGAAIDVVISQSNAIKAFLTTMPPSLALDVEDVGRIENVETAVQKMELVLDAWVGIVRMWRHLLAIEAGLATATPSAPSSAHESALSPLSLYSPSALNESFSRHAIARATRPCIDLTTLLRVQFEILMREPRFHFYLYAQAVPRRAFDCGLVLARILTLCEGEQDQKIAARALEALRRVIDLLERAAKWFQEQSGDGVVEEAETLKLLRMLLARTNNRVELLDLNNAGSKRSREAMEGMSDISAARLGDLHGLRLPFTPDMLILDPVQPCRSPSVMTQPTSTQSTHHGRLRESPAKSTPSSLAPSPPSTSLLNSMNVNAVSEPSSNGSLATGPVAHLDKPTAVRSFGRPSPPVLNEGTHGEDRDVERGPMAKLRKIQPKDTVPQADENNSRASQTTRGVAMNLDHVSSVPPNVQDARSIGHHHLHASQQQAVNGTFTSSSYGPSHGGMTSGYSLWMGHPWHGVPDFTPISVPEASVHPHANAWTPSPITGPTTAGMDSYTEEPYKFMGMSPMSFAPVASGAHLGASMGDNSVVPHNYVSYPSATAPESPTHSHFSSSYGPSPLPPSAPLHNEPTPDSIPQPGPRARVPQHPQQPPWHYETDHAST